jgi:uncharacterized membrane protein YkvI
LLPDSSDPTEEAFVLGKGVTLTDCLLTIAVMLPLGLAVGAGIGLSKNYFGLPNHIGTLILITFVVLAGRFSQRFVARRVKARAVAGQK